MGPLASHKKVSFERTNAAPQNEPAGGKRLRFSQTKGLHVHSRFGFSIKDFLAKFRNPGALRRIEEARRAAVAQVLSETTKRFGEVVGSAIFSKVMGETPQSVSFEQLRTITNIEEDGEEFNQSIENVFASLSEDCGFTPDPERAIEIKQKMARVVLNLETLDENHCERAAIAAAIADDLLQRASDVSVQSRTPPGTKGQMDAVIKTIAELLQPDGAFSHISPKEVHETLKELIKTTPYPIAIEMKKAVVRTHETNVKPLSEKLTIVADYIKGEATQVLGKGGGIVPFRLDPPLEVPVDESAPQGEMKLNPIVSALHFLKSAGSPFFATKIPALKTLVDEGQFEYRSGHSMDKRTKDSAEATNIAAKSLQTFKTAIGLLFGSDDTSTQAAVNDLDPDFCKLFANAHRATEAVYHDRPDLDEERKVRHQQWNTQIALRVLTPLLNNALLASDDGRALSKLIQNAANDIATIKEGVHPSVAETLPKALEDASKSYQRFVDLARERGEALLAREAE